MAAVRFRNWAFESAALDLALRQAGRALHDVPGIEPQPVRFVNSLGLGKAPSIEPVRRRLARSQGVRFKLDAETTWSAALVDEVAATGAVDTIDFKGHYGFEVKDHEALGVLYDRVLAAFPDAYLEDPHHWPEIARRVGDHAERVSHDAPIRSAEDIGAMPLPTHVVNIKPSRIGSLELAPTSLGMRGNQASRRRSLSRVRRRRGAGAQRRRSDGPAAQRRTISTPREQSSRQATHRRHRWHQGIAAVGARRTIGSAD